MPMLTPPTRLARALVTAFVVALGAGAALAQRARPNDAYQPPGDSAGLGTLGGTPAPAGGSYGQYATGQPQTYGSTYGQSYGQSYGQTYGNQGQSSSGPPPHGPDYANNGTQANGASADDSYRPAREDGYGQPYAAPPAADQGPGPRADGSEGNGGNPSRGYYSQGEIVEKGKGFFGSIAQGLASAIEYTYQQAGRPNGYILGEDGGGAFFAGLRYGQGTLYTKDAGDHKMYWQGPSLGWDVGGEGSKVMVLVYNLSQPGDIYHRFGGVEGSTYVVGGVSVQFQKHDDVTLAVIRSGVGLRLGVNVGYLKYTREPTLNPF